MGWGWVLRRFGFVSVVPLMIYVATLPPALFLFSGGKYYMGAVLAELGGATGAIVGAVVFTVFLGKSTVGCPSIRQGWWGRWGEFVLIAMLVTLAGYLFSVPMPVGIAELISGLGSGLSLASLGFIIVSWSPGACSFIDRVLERKGVRSRRFRSFVFKAMAGYMVAIFVAIPITAFSNPSLDVVSAYVSIALSVTIAAILDIYGSALAIYLPTQGRKRSQ